MFTGIIEAQGIITRADREAGGLELEIYAPSFGRDMRMGESISVDGVCLTLENFLRGAFVTHLSRETMNRSTLGGLHPGAKVNLERAMTGADRFGGHFVTGHVDATGKIASKRPAGGGTEIGIAAPDSLKPFFLEKGSVAVDGISLTIAALTREGFSTVVIPHTEVATALDGKNIGDAVNLEADMMAKYVRRYVHEMLSNKTSSGRSLLDAFARGED